MAIKIIEERINAFPDDLKKIPEFLESQSNRDDPANHPPSRSAQRNQEGAGNDPPSDPSDNSDSGNSSGGGPSRGRNSEKKKVSKLKKKSVKSRAPAIRNLPNPCVASVEILTAKRQVREDIVKEYRSPLAREEYAKVLLPLSLEELKLTLDSVKAWQNFFVNKELPRLYKSKTKGLLARYFSLFATEGFSDHVAIDDCDVAQFVGAILGPDSPLCDKDPNFILSDNIQRPDPPIVLNSCRKHQGVKLVTCVPNGSEPRDGYTIYHCGELIRRDAPADSLKMSFSPEAIETERAIGTLAIIIGPEEFFQLEDLTRRLDEHPKAKRRESMPIPAPINLSPYKGRLSLVTYLRSQ